MFSFDLNLKNLKRIKNTLETTRCIPVTRVSTRCALGLWFSHDANYWEPEIGLAWDLV